MVIVLFTAIDISSSSGSNRVAAAAAVVVLVDLVAVVAAAVTALNACSRSCGTEVVVFTLFYNIIIN